MKTIQQTECYEVPEIKVKVLKKRSILTQSEYDTVGGNIENYGDWNEQ